MPKGEENHGFRHSPAGADEIPGLIVLVPSEDNPTQDPYTPEEGDLLVGQESPLGFARYPFDPADSSSTRNVLAGDQGDTKPTWKAQFDGTNPADVVAPTAAAAPGTSLLAAHRDHGHSLTTAETDTSKRLAPDGSGGVEWSTGGSGGPIYIPFGSEAVDGHELVNDSGGDFFDQFGYVTRSLNPADYSATPLRVVLEVVLASNGIQPAQARLYNVTAGAFVSDSLVETFSTTPVRLRSPLLTLATGDNVYRIERGGPDDTNAICYDAVVIIGGSEVDAGTSNPSAGVTDDMPNEIRNHPSLEGADDAQPEWWEEADGNATLTEVDLAGEGITEKYERALKVVVATANSYAYQQFTYADEPRLKSGKTYSVAVDVWSVSSVAARIRLQSSVGSLGASSDTTAAAWTRLEVEAIALNGTTLQLRLEVDIGTAYFVPLGLVEGTVAPTTQLRPRALRYKHAPTQPTIETLSGLSTKAVADVDLTANTSPLAFMAQMKIFMFEPTNGEIYQYYARRNGSSLAVDGDVNTIIASSFGDSSESPVHEWLQLLDDGQIFESALERQAGAGTISVCLVFLVGWWEWE